MYVSPLPQLSAPRPFLTDGGLETDLIFHHGIELPSFAAFVLLDTERGRQTLQSYLAPYLRLARSHGVGFVIETPTWRANPDWGRELGYDARALDRVNREAVAWARAVAAEVPDVEVVVSGCVGPRGDGYVVTEPMGAPEAAAYHLPQVAALAGAGADLVTALTLTSAAEAIGVARAAEAVGIASVISFTVETDGRLPSGQPLGDAVRDVDESTDSAPAYYMINCAHPSHFEHVLDGPWTARVRGRRVNASACSHAALDATETLDIGDPTALAVAHRRLATQLDFAVVGGCCGTDLRHITVLTHAVTPPPAGSRP